MGVAFGGSNCSLAEVGQLKVGLFWGLVEQTEVMAASSGGEARAALQHLVPVLKRDVWHGMEEQRFLHHLATLASLTAKHFPEASPVWSG